LIFQNVHPERLITSLSVKKGDPVFIPIKALNRAKFIWGEDAFEFKSVCESSPSAYRSRRRILTLSSLNVICSPDRWDHLPEEVHHMPGVWSNILSFLAGPRSCIGYRFSLIEFVFSFIIIFHLHPRLRSASGERTMITDE
jgi:cytochrome P450